MILDSIAKLSLVRTFLTTSDVNEMNVDERESYKTFIQTKLYGLTENDYYDNKVYEFEDIIE